MRDRGVAAEDVVRGWVIATDVLSIHERAGELKRNAATTTAESELSAFLALERATRCATGWALGELEPATSIGAAVTRFKPAFETLCGEFETMLAGGERDRFERLYRELRRDVSDGELAHGLARLAFADHILSVLSLSFAREIEPAQTARAYFQLSAQLNFSILDETLQSVGDKKTAGSGAPPTNWPPNFAPHELRCAARCSTRSPTILQSVSTNRSSSCSAIAPIVSRKSRGFSTS